MHVGDVEVLRHRCIGRRRAAEGRAMASISLTSIVRGVVIGLVLLALTGWVMANVTFVGIG